MPAPIIKIFLGATVAVMIGKRASEAPATAIVLCFKKLRRVMDIRLIQTSDGLASQYQNVRNSHSVPRLLDLSQMPTSVP